MSLLMSCLVASVLNGQAFAVDASVMSDRYREVWNDAEQAKIDAAIERNRKADGTFAVDAPAGTEVTVERSNGSSVSFRGFRGRYRLTWTTADGKTAAKLVDLK